MNPGMQKYVYSGGANVQCLHLIGPDARSGKPTGASKDAILLSPHKFVGGVGTPGMFIVKRVSSATSRGVAV